jgi:hypothetical protein
MPGDQADGYAIEGVFPDTSAFPSTDLDETSCKPISGQHC